MNAQASLLAIDRDVLLPVVRRVLRDTTVEIVDWTIDKLDHLVVIDSTGGLFRIKGTGRTGGESMP